MEDEQVQTEEVNEGEVEETPPAPSFRPIASQDELDRVISERLRRERSKFADYADLKRKAEEFDRISEANKSESERMTSRLTEAEAKAQALAAKVRSKALRAEVAEVSARLGIVDADTALALISGSVEFDNDDEPVGVEDSLKELVKRKPFLRAARFEGSADSGARNAPVDMSTLDMDTYMARRRKP